MRLHNLRNALSLMLCLAAAPAFAVEADFRLKWFSALSAFPDHDVQRQVQGTPAVDHSLDLRSLFRHRAGRFQLLADHSIVLLTGDTAAQAGGLDSSLDQTVSGDERRWMDLTWEIEDGARHRSFHRLDRLAVQWQPGDWTVTLGRQAVSWGSGIVFQPMDVFNPFSPTVVDRDYKAGDDLLMIDRLLANGHDLQFLHVVRRNQNGDVSAAAASSALKWHGYASLAEFEVVAARHYDQPFYATSVRLPAGQALVRADLIATRGERGRWRYSGVINGDVTFLVNEKNAYVFAEYFHNDWGVRKLPDSAALLPLELQERLSRGELFNLMRDYIAVGGSYEWHPLLNHSMTVIANLHDGSMLLQTGFTYVPGDRQTLQMGWIEPLGSAGDEFGGVPVFGTGLTTGGASRVYLRWVYYL